MKRILGVALVAAVALVPAAAAASQKKHPRRSVRLSLLPLQAAQLGSVGASLPIQYDSGRVPNGNASPLLKKLGRLDGYQLDYGDSFSGGTGVTSIETQVESFRSPAGAKKALKFWRIQDKGEAAAYHEIGIVVNAHFFKVRAVGSGHFAYLTWLRIPNADPLYTVDEEATSGSFVLHATVAAGTESAAERLAPVLTAKLVHRLHQLLDGHLHAAPATLPQPPAAGPPEGGPDLSTLVLGPSDFTGPATPTLQDYAFDPAALSAYVVDLRPAGQYAEFQQVVDWYGDANEATWEGTLISDVSSAGASESGIDLSAIGDNAHGAIGQSTDDLGNPVFIAVVVLWTGQTAAFGLAERPTAIEPSDVQALAKAMADKLNAGLAG